VNIFIQTFIDFISLGSLYALLAVGLALVFGIMRFINFAHGELIMVAGYALIAMAGQNFALMVVAAVASSIALALLMERAGFRPIRGASPATQLVTSFALSFLIQSAMTVAIGAQAKSVGVPRIFTTQFDVAGIPVPNLAWITVLVAIAATGSLALFLKRTTIGVQMRAAAEDFEMAGLLGVRANRVIATAFAISGLLAAVASIMLVAGGGLVLPSMGFRPIVIAFVAVILGGLGSLRGAAIGAFALAFLTDFAQAYLPLNLQSFRDVFVFLIVIVIFFVRPKGIVVVRGLNVRA
jgi:branched-chain amino acid transport system permease protein